MRYAVHRPLESDKVRKVEFQSDLKGRKDRKLKDKPEKEASVSILPEIKRDARGNVLHSKTIVTIDVLPKGTDFSLKVESESISPKFLP